MGARFSGAREQEDDEEEEEDEEDEYDEEDAAIRTPQPKKITTSSKPVAAVPTKNFAELAAEASAKKKKAPVIVQNSAAAEFAAAKAKAAAKKAAAKAKEGPKKRMPPVTADEEQVLHEVAEEGLPRGCEGATWIALEDSPVREDRDVKSAKKGVIQTDETCQQTGPWRADPSGRVRMPVRGARCFGWVTVDSTKCRGSDGSWGSRAFRFVAEPTEEVSKPDEPNPSLPSRASIDDEIDDLLDMFGDDDPPDVQEDLLDAQENLAYEDHDTQEGLASKACGSKIAVEATPVSDLTPAQKRLRNVRKKIRELEVLEAKSGSLSAAQSARLERKNELLEEEKIAVAEIKKEANAGKKKRPKIKKPAAKKVTNERSSATTASRGWYLIWFALLPAVALSISYFVMK